MPATFCQLFSCEHYLRRRVAGVFHYDSGSRYSLTYMEASLACERDFGATMADKKQLLAANEAGMEECRAGWILEAEVAYPRVHLSWNCGQNQAGIISYGVRKNLLENDSLLTANVEMASTTTTPRLNFTTGIPEMFEATTRMSCGGVLSEGYGDIQSPGFPRAYPSELDCTWVIVVQQGHVVQLTFQSMDLEEHRGCEYDYIIVFDGRTSEKQEIGRFCGRELPPTLRSSSNIMTVTMKSDSSVELGGFSARYQTSKTPASSGIVVRLIGGKNQFEGHVEIDITGVKVGVCAENWGKREATLVCGKLGFMGNAMARRMPVSADDLPVSMFVVKCHGDEQSLDQCEMHRESACSILTELLFTAKLQSPVQCLETLEFLSLECTSLTLMVLLKSRSHSLSTVTWTQNPGPA
ncbi:hypothetical protein GJAV_G00070750 [Gymnothorax javanicus]|nr:hypothetical protein GJAV_G00070750 [Gymnothorax javanicus]